MIANAMDSVEMILLRHMMTHVGAATLCRLVLLYTFTMATKECECGMIIRDHPNAHYDQFGVKGTAF